MYKSVIRPILFCMPPEAMHHFVVTILKIAGIIPGGKWFLRKCFTVKHPVLEREVFGMKFPNPVGLAAGFDKNAQLYNELSCFGFGFIEVGTITPKAQMGNPKPRIFRLVQDSAVINRMGYNNNGVEKAVENLKKHIHKKYSPIIGGNLGKNTLTPNENAPADYLSLFRRLYDYVDYFVINVSCPNVANLNKIQGESLKAIIDGVVDFRKGQGQYRPILLKISPDLNTEQIDDAIRIMKECNLDGIVATNTTTSREGLVTDNQTVKNIGNGGLSGKPLTKRAVEIVRYVHEKTEGQYPIIGVGGIMTEDDAVAMLNAGASLIQVYTGFIYEGPMFVKNICLRLIREAATKKKSNE